MSKVFFFTDPNAISATQNSDFAFGPLSSSSTHDVYNLENKFSVTDNAPAIAICKSLLLAQEVPSNPELLNIALIPIQVNILNNIPIKFFVYRGIKRSSLYGADGKILTTSNMRPDKNIIDRIQDIQQKMNTENNTTMIATKRYLGCEITGDLYLEQAFFQESNNGPNPQNPNLFHPMIVDAGFEIGKFKGGTTKAGFQIILDKIGYEPKLTDFRKQNDIFEVPKLSVTATGEQKFRDRVQKERILAYMDYCAFLGNFYSNGDFKIKIYSSQSEDNVEIKNILDKFYNKNVVYIDIRDDYGNSYNHYFKTSDTIKLYLKNSSNQMVVNEMDYYSSKWPILQLRDYQVSGTSSSGNEAVQIAFPMEVGDPVSNYILYAYNMKMGNNIFSTLQANDSLHNENNNNKIIFHYSRFVSFKKFKVENGKFLSNYILLKLSNNKNEFLYNQGDRLDNVFPLHMKDILGDEDLDDGDFRVYVYSSINAPIIRKNRKAYLVNMGIAKDKENVTFFVFNSQSIKESYNGNKVDNGYQQLFNLLTPGKYSYQMYIDEFEYTSGQSLGFLSALPYRCINGENSDFMLQYFLFKKNQNTNYKTLAYVKAGEGTLTDAFFEDFDAFCITNTEYREVLKKVITPVSNSNYDTSFDFYREDYYDCIRFNNPLMSLTFDESSLGTTVFRYHPVYIDFTGTHLSPSDSKKYEFAKKNTGKILCRSSFIPSYFLRVIGVPTNLASQNTIKDIKWNSIGVDMEFSTMEIV
ncbi:hypothetical protein [Chryseobacterium sp. Leaf201]|uniref:hypothetical protein n=1 Tax=Chryseobacterium sp. Leaf201 TaxID=1735672 RepID=UPI0006FD3E36|nr:hypothetical protein [Chryseobacterium sp. Leaf201]KQM57037.1 hypothetical protein ASE55_19245 [Chryseobacterium sp. Leaf201]